MWTDHILYFPAGVVHTFGVVILPAAVPPTIALLEGVTNITLQEDEPKQGDIPVTVGLPMSLDIGKR